MGENVALAKGRIRTSQTNGGRINVADADRRRQQKEVDLGEVNIDARLYKPSVFYVLARGGLSWHALEIHHNFVPRILRDALKRPF